MPRIDEDSVVDWSLFQDCEQAAYKWNYARTGSYLGHFSVPEFRTTEQIAERLAQVDGCILDVGCGILPMPNYLKLHRCVFGIDPYLGDLPRQFPFAQAVGESLPFKSATFDAALLMSALDHVREPKTVLREVRRVLRTGGSLFIWYTSRAKPDRWHPWYFAFEDLNALLQSHFVHKERTMFDRGPGFSRTELAMWVKNSE